MAAQLVPTPTGQLIVPSTAATGSAGVRLSLVVPTLNEAANITALLEQLRAVLEPLLHDAYEIIVVDDDSPDHTWQVALAVAERDARIKVMRRESERGLSTAVIRGWQVARGEIIGVMDADLQHPVEINLTLFEKIEGGANLASASRHEPGGGVSDWSAQRRVVSRSAQLLGLLLLPRVLSRLSDPMSGYFMLRRSAIAGVLLAPLGYKILIEVVARGNVGQIEEVPYVFRERGLGESKLTWRLYLEYVRHLLQLRFSRSGVGRTR